MENIPGNANQPQPGLKKLTAKELAAKMRSKREVYRFMASEVRCYLPSYDTVTIFHLKDLACGRRKIINSKDVQVYQVPQFEGLSVDEMLKFGANYPEVMNALPVEEKEVRKLPRDYIANVIYTLTKEAFVNWVEMRVKARNDKLIED